MATQIEMVAFSTPGRDEPIALPAMWKPEVPGWLRKLGKTFVMVIDDQIQSLAELSDEDQLRKRICEPLNVEFVFCPECATGYPIAGDKKWFEPVVTRINKLRDCLAAVFLDVMFEGECDPLRGSGLEFLRKIHSHVPDLPVLIMTQARDEQKLHEKIAESGLHLAFFQKGSPDRVDALCRFLCEYGWLSDPTFCAYSTSMRATLSGLRRYAIRRPLLDTEMPRPILFTADSGEGKTRTAQLAAEWLMQVEPPVRSRREREAIVTLDCNTLDRDQGAKIALFGRGPLDNRERTDSSGLAVRGAVQRASDGILIIDEVGNSPHGFQDMLLAFVESGRTEPEFRNNQMTREALGPLDVLCIFTAQPRHIEDKKIKEDLLRRYARGTTVRIPPLAERLSDVVPIFYQVLEACKGGGIGWGEPPEIDSVLLPDAQDWLREAVKRHRLSASLLVDLAGEPEIKVIGTPYLEHRLKEIFASRSDQELLETLRELQAPVAALQGQNQVLKERVAELEQELSHAKKPLGGPDAFELVDRLAADELFCFPQATDRLRGLLSKVEAAAGNLLLAYLETALEVARGARKGINVLGTYKFVSGDQSKSATVTTARTRLKDLMLVSRDRTIQGIKQSDLLASLAIDIANANRSQEIQDMLSEIAEDANQANRLQSLGWKKHSMGDKEDENRCSRRGLHLP